MSDSDLPTGPDSEAITEAILERYPETDVVTAMGATFFSLDPDKHWPNFATIVTTDEHDAGAPSRLSERPAAFRVNIGVGRPTFERLVADAVDPDYAASDTIVPHPTYAKQLWVSIVNPSEATFRERVLPLIEEAHDRVAASRARHREAAADGGS